MLRLCYQIFLIHIIGLNAIQNGGRENYKRNVIPRSVKSMRNAFSNDINACLFNDWVNKGILSSQVICNCPNHGLCYGLINSQALFISCYNSDTRIPAFTAHVVRPAMNTISNNQASAKIIPKIIKKIKKTKKIKKIKKIKNTKKIKKIKNIKIPSVNRLSWKKDTGTYAPVQQAEDSDYRQDKQFKNYPNWRNWGSQFYCARGHLTPNADFDIKAERDITQILTNAAPQWQKSNNGNWKAVEIAVRKYAENNKAVEVFVVTGTEGTTNYKIGPMTAPKYFWKAVCANGQSIVFVAENNVGESSNAAVNQGTCLSMAMTKANGVIQCGSLNQVRQMFNSFKFPDFTNGKCNINNQGTFLDVYLNFQ